MAELTQTSLLDGIPPLFDASRSEEARQIGMDQAAENKKSLLKFARKVAREVAQRKGIVSMDDIAMELHSHNISIFALGNSAGSLFLEKENGKPIWQWTGTFVKSIREHSHGNLLRQWRLKRTAISDTNGRTESVSSVAGGDLLV